MYFETGSVMRSLPSSIIIMTAMPVPGLVVDAMRKAASFVIGFFESMSVTPVASKCAIFPCRATSVTPPEISPAATCRFIISVMRASRSLERPTSSGLTIDVCAIGRIASTDTNTNAAAADTTRSFIQSSTSNFLLLTSYFLRSPSGTFDVLRVLLVFLADVFHQLLGRTQARVERDGKRLRVVRRIGDRRLHHERAEVRARVTLHRVQLLAVRVAAEIEPELVIEPDGVDDERLTLVVADRVAVPGRIRIVGVLPAVDEDLPVAVNVAFEQDEDVRRRLQNAQRVRRLARHARRQTVRFGIVPRVP